MPVEPKAESASTARKRIRELKVMVADVIVETGGRGLLLWTGNHQVRPRVSLGRGEEAAPRFLKSTLAGLAAVGINKRQIHRECYR